MIIYHGSTVVVKQPAILQSGRMVDFGAGFYATSNKEQALIWARLVAVRREMPGRFLSVYEFDFEKAEKELAIVRFAEPDEAWLDFVCANRRDRETPRAYDMVFGPVADDRVYTVVQYYENGVYDKDEAIKRLKADKLYDQFLFHTEKSLEYCRFTGYEDLGGAK
jgi:hypothetical protein